MSARRVDDDLLALFALDALEPAEARWVADAVAQSPALAARLEVHRSALADLGAASAIPPPPDLKQRVLEAAFTELPAQDHIYEEPPGIVIPLSERRRARWRAVIPAIGVAAAVALAMVLVQRGGEDPELAAVLAGVDDAVIAIEIAGDTMSLSAEELPVLDADHEYQLWLIDGDDEVRSAGVFAPGPDGRFVASMAVEVQDAEAVAVTIEPTGGSPAATTPILYQGTLGAASG